MSADKYKVLFVSSKLCESDNPVNKIPDAKPTGSDKLENAKTDLTSHEPVNPKQTEEKTTDPCVNVFVDAFFHFFSSPKTIFNRGATLPMETKTAFYFIPSPVSSSESEASFSISAPSC